MREIPKVTHEEDIPDIGVEGYIKVMQEARTDRMTDHGISKDNRLLKAACVIFPIIFLVNAVASYHADQLPSLIEFTKTCAMLILGYLFGAKVK